MQLPTRWIISSVCAGAVVCAAIFLPHRAAADDMQPTSSKNIIETATGPDMGNVTTVVKAIEAADLVDTLKSAGPFTVFAPTNEAFEKLPPGTLDDLMKPENKDKLKAILLYHVHIDKAIMTKDMTDGMTIHTAEGHDLKITKNGDTIMVNDAKIVKPDIVCSNGVIDQIDTVLMPPQ